MSKCAWCGKKGFFLFVDRNGLCHSCWQAVYSDIEQIRKLILESKEVLGESGSFKSRLSGVDSILDHLQALKKYEEKGILSVQPSPSELEAHYKELKNDFMDENILG